MCLFIDTSFVYLDRELKTETKWKSFLYLYPAANVLKSTRICVLYIIITYMFLTFTQSQFFFRCKTDKILSILTWKAFNLKQEGEKDSLLKPSDKRYHSTYSVNVVDRHKKFFTIIMTTFGWEFIYCNFGILLCALAYLCIPFLLG